MKVETKSGQGLLLIAHGSRSAAATQETYALADQLAQRLQIHVEPCFLELADPPIIDGIRACIDRGIHTIIALPLFLGPAGHQKNDVPAVINWARREWPQVQFCYGTPLGVQSTLVTVLSERLRQTIEQAEIPGSAQVCPEQTAAIVVGRGSRDPDSNGDVAKLARLLYEGRDYAWVEPAYYSLATPGVEAIIAKYAQLGAKRVVLLPYLLFTGRIYERIQEQAAEAAQQHQIETLVAPYLFPHPALLEAVLQRFEEAASGVAAMTCDLCKYRVQFDGFESEFGLPQTSDHSHGLRGVPHSHGIIPLELDAKLAQILPPRYQENGQTENGVSAAPMGAADLAFNDDGTVAWDNMWEDFCDLAMAGGPTHRGELLEPVDPQQIKDNDQAYQRVVQELGRGIQLVTGLDITQSRSPGWVGMACDNQEMAIWLLRAIVVENIFARREDNVIYFPAGPHFELKNEIKSIITVAAKTHHYWQEHLGVDNVSYDYTNSSTEKPNGS